MSIHHSPCVMTNTEQFFVRVCGCGVVHLNFGPAIVNATAETVIAMTETLKEISQELRRHISCYDPVNSEQASIDAGGNVIVGKFS